ncbi:DNA polymerase domain-containing protein [Nanoarchaeota archaeon]
MKAWLMDVYRSKNRIVLWLKTPDEDIRLVRKYTPIIYLESSTIAKRFLEENKINYRKVRRKTYLRKLKTVLEVKVTEPFELFVKWIEKKSRYRINMYNADIPPEQLFMFENNLRPLSLINIHDSKGITSVKQDVDISLTKIDIAIFSQGKQADNVVNKIIIDDIVLEGSEKEVLTKFVDYFVKKNPDVILMEYAFSQLPFLVSRLTKNKLYCPFHRWDPTPINYKGGKSTFYYGRVMYRDFAIRLNGRFLVDTCSLMGSEVDLEGISELCKLSGARFQITASRSFGAAFQFALMREMIQRKYLVPYKEKPIDAPITLFELFKADRAGHTFDPKVGFHKNVAEIDFSSMFPWIIYNYNISADTILSRERPFLKVPKIPVKISLKHKGLVPISIKPFIDRRMEYKKNPTSVNKAKSIGLKWLLVVSYGYQRFREFKLGLGRSHMSVGSFAREIMINSKNLAEEKGFDVIHGIIDSLYIKKKGIDDVEVKDFCKELEVMSGIPVSFEGIFKWVVFCSSVNNINRPVPARYFGVFKNGEIKVRGLEIRQKGTPLVVKQFQQACLEIISVCDTKKEIISKAPDLAELLRRILKSLHKLEPKYLTCSVKISKTIYKTNIPQKIIVEKLKKKGVELHAGQKISYLFQNGCVVLVDEFVYPDYEKYKKLLVRALYNVLQQFGFTKKLVLDLISSERQTKIEDYIRKHFVKYIFVPMKKDYFYKPRQGLSERLLKRRLEKQGWIVWRGGSIDVLRRGDNYPNVIRKYKKLCSLLDKYFPDCLDYLQYLCSVHHGMPDFICFRNGEFKFVECKLGYESLSKRQKKCIPKLQSLGFNVEVHKLVEPCTKTRVASIDIVGGFTRVLEKQAKLKVHY